MKKLIALVTALCLCLCSVSAMAYTLSISTLELEPSYEAQITPVGENGLTLELPADWVSGMELPEGALALFSDVEQTMQLQVGIVDQSIETLLDEAKAQQSNGEVGMVEEWSLNELYFVVCYADDMMTVSHAYVALNEEQSVMFTYTIPDPELYMFSMLTFEIMSTIAVAE